MTHPSHPFRVEALCPVPLGPMPTTGTLSPWALRPLGDPVVVCQVRSTFRVSVHPLPPAHCRVCPAGRSRRRSAHPRETGIRVFSVIPDGGRSHPLGLEFKQSSLTPAWPNSRTSLGPRRWASRRFIRMLLSPQSFRTKVSGSFYPPSSSGVRTLPTRPDKPLPRRTASVRRHRSRFEVTAVDPSDARYRTTKLTCRGRLQYPRIARNQYLGTGLLEQGLEVRLRVFQSFMVGLQSFMVRHYSHLSERLGSGSRGTE